MNRDDLRDYLYALLRDVDNYLEYYDSYFTQEPEYRSFDDWLEYLVIKYLQDRMMPYPVEELLYIIEDDAELMSRLEFVYSELDTRQKDF